MPPPPPPPTPPTPGQLHFLKKLVCYFRGFKDLLKPRCGSKVENAGLDMLMLSMTTDAWSFRKSHIDLEGNGIEMVLF